MKKVKNQIKLLVSEFFLKPSFLQKGNIFKDLDEKGIHIIPNFLSEEECKLIVKNAEDFLKNNPNLLKKESNGSDIRVYGIDRFDSRFNISKMKDFSDSLFNKFSWNLRKFHFLLFGKIISSKENLGSGSGWHRDSPFRHQFKTILYLSDVDEDNGPFQFIEGSHKKTSIKRSSVFLNKSLSEDRFREEEIEQLITNNKVNKEKTCVGKAGTLIIVNTRGLHRGKPLIKDKRYALTNYYFNNNPERFFKK